MYWSIENFALYTAVHFFQIFIFGFLSAYYYVMSLSDFRPIFLYEFKLNHQSAAEAARIINQAFGNDGVNFFQLLIFCLFSVYYYMMSLSDFRPIFLYEFKLNQCRRNSPKN